ncbi:hypothetical protein D7X87_08740 [bacterium D16-54]|nr:hypothetical protein D7X87_08740 [bacterium D16-54]RKJ15202.1 hypothetical protein D7X65_08740 [bacterium D16-56]
MKINIKIIGYPRNDLFVSNTQNIKEKVRKRFNISNEKKIILYAPTYRD